jgi:hypothetical protein
VVLALAGWTSIVTEFDRSNASAVSRSIVREQRADVTNDHACLLRIGGYDEDGSAFTRSQVAAIVEEAREINGAERKDEALAGAAPTHEPSFVC